MAKSIISKIVYFDKETIRNILQERDHGELSRITDVSSAIQSQISATAEASTSLKLEVPLFSRIAFLFTGKIDASYVIKKDSSTTISSTEISEFEKLKPLLVTIPNVQLTDIENSQHRSEWLADILKLSREGSMA